jgi:hypothetical protein
MKKTFVLLFIITICITSFGQKVNNEEIEAIKKTIQTAYVEGLQNEGDFDKIDSGFHPSFKLIGIKDGSETWELPIEKWKKSVEKRKAKGVYPRTGEDKISIKFLNVDVTGNAAMAKFEFYIGERLAYVDYMSLYKFDKGWMIISKIYYEFPKEK